MEPIEAGEQESSFNIYRKSNRDEILLAHRVPISKIGIPEGINLAAARDADKTFKDLTRDVFMGLIADTGADVAHQIQQAWFGNCGMGTFGQRNIRGQVCFTPLVREEIFPERVPLINVEGGCATASMAFHGAYKDILSGECDLSLAMGVEKTFFPGNPERTMEIFQGGIDQLDPHEWEKYYLKAGEQSGKPFVINSGGGTLFMDTYAMQARLHMSLYGTTREQIAAACAKSHTNGSLNPLAQYRFPMTAQQVLDDRMVADPLTRSMCAPLGDGAAAAIFVRSNSVVAIIPETAGNKISKVSMLSKSGSLSSWRSRL